ncbi:unnamed protein product, partial [Effrenium voratum]
VFELSDARDAAQLREKHRGCRCERSYSEANPGSGEREAARGGAKNYPPHQRAESNHTGCRQARACRGHGTIAAAAAGGACLSAGLHIPAGEFARGGPRQHREAEPRSGEAGCCQPRCRGAGAGAPTEPAGRLPARAWALLGLGAAGAFGGPHFALTGPRDVDQPHGPQESPESVRG